MFHAERKMLMYLFSNYSPDKQYIWKIFLYSEKAFCKSCDLLINRVIRILTRIGMPYYNEANSIVAMDGSGNIYDKTNFKEEI